MFANEQMRHGARCIAAMFGGPGIFYVLESFQRPGDAATGFIYLVIATALVLMAGREAGPEPSRRLAVARRKAELLRRKRKD